MYFFPIFLLQIRTIYPICIWCYIFGHDLGHTKKKTISMVFVITPIFIAPKCSHLQKFTLSNSNKKISFIFGLFRHWKKEMKIRECVQHLVIKFKPGRFNSSIIWCIYNYYLKFVQFMIWKNLLINKIHIYLSKALSLMAVDYFRNVIELASHWLLCGCSFRAAERESEREREVISLGFDGVWFALRDFFIQFSMYNDAQAPIND